MSFEWIYLKTVQPPQDMGLERTQTSIHKLWQQQDHVDLVE